MAKLYNPKKSALFQGENMSWLPLIPDESVDLIYIDPPFFTKLAWRGQGIGNKIRFSDKWSDVGSYIACMRERLLEARRALRPTGAVFLHCDWRATHYLRLLMDKAFGEANHVNEIIWIYRGIDKGGYCFRRHHDTIHFYRKSGDFKKKFQRLYAHSSLGGGSRYTYCPARKARVSVYSRQFTNSGAARFPRKKIAREPERGHGFSEIPDCWAISVLGSAAKERTGYPTQKPLALLKRIISCASAPGDLVLDFYGGSGTTAHAAHALGRRFITGDKNAEAIRVIKHRLSVLGLKPEKGYVFYGGSDDEAL